MKPYDLIYELFSVVLSLDGERVQSNFVAWDICANFNEILLQSAISSTYLRKSFVKENIVFKAKKPKGSGREFQDWQKAQIFLFLETIDATFEQFSISFCAVQMVWKYNKMYKISRYVLKFWKICCIWQCLTGWNYKFLKCSYLSYSPAQSGDKSMLT